MSNKIEDIEAVESFSISLADLMQNGKSQINFLTTVARENLSQSEAIVKAIDDHLRKVSSKINLPILLLIDSIIKNVGGNYISLLPPILTGYFVMMYKKADKETRQSMCQLRKSWSSIITSRCLKYIDSQINALDPDWPFSVDSFQPFENAPVKILVNRNFLPSNFAKIAGVASLEKEEEDDADILREQLLLQKRLRDMQKECQGDKVLSEPMKSPNELSSNDIYVPISKDIITAENQADSTTMDKSPNIQDFDNKSNKEDLNSSIAPTLEKSAHDKAVNGQLLHLLSGLINKQNHRSKSRTSDRRHSLNDDLRYYESQSDYNRVYHFKSDEWTRYSDRSYYRSYYDSSYSKAYGGHHWSIQRRDNTFESKYDRTRRAKHHDYHLPVVSSTRQTRSHSPYDFHKTDLEAKSNSQKSFRSFALSSELSQTSSSTPENCMPQTLEASKDNLSCSHLKRKLESKEIDDAPQVKSSCGNIVPLSGSSSDSIPNEENLDLSNANISHPSFIHDSCSDPPQSLDCSNSSHSFGGVYKKKQVKAYDIDHERSAYVPPYVNKQCPFPKLMSFPLSSESNMTTCNSINSFRASQDSAQLNRSEASTIDSWKPVGLLQEKSLVLLPPANSFILDKISQDSMKTIAVDKLSREVRFYGEIAVIGSGTDNPREISFKPGEAFIVINNVPVLCAFHKPENEVFVEGKTFRVRLGAPTRELYVNDEGFQCAFNCSPVQIQLFSGEVLHVQLQSNSPPTVQIGALRKDLVAGQVILSVDAMHFIRIFLDAKPQRFDVGGLPHILKFADALQTILVNDHPVNMQFGGAPIAITVSGVKHFVGISELPPHIIPGQVHIISMGRVQADVNVARCSSYVGQQNYVVESTGIQVGETVRPPRQQRKTIWKGKHKGKKRSRTGLMNQRALQRAKYITPEVMRALLPCVNPTPIGSNLDCTLNRAAEPVTSGKDWNTAPAYKPDVNVHELFQSLCSVGLLRPQTSNVEVRSVNEEIFEVDFMQPSTLKRRQARIVEVLHLGTQCSSCGERFPLDNTEIYRQHLDFHFQQNHRLKDPGSSRNRLWYYDKKTWIQHDSTAAEMDKLHKKSKKIESSVPSHDYPKDSVCELCREKFEEFFHHDEDEWHLKDCVSSEGLTYHPMCFKDYQNSVGLLNKGTNVITIDLDDEEKEENLDINKKGFNTSEHNKLPTKPLEEANESQSRMKTPSEVVTHQNIAGEIRSGPRQNLFSLASLSSANHKIFSDAAPLYCEEKSHLPVQTKEHMTFIAEQTAGLCNNKELIEGTGNFMKWEEFQNVESEGDSALAPLTTFIIDATSLRPLSPCDSRLKVQSIDRSCLREDEEGSNRIEYSCQSNSVSKELECVDLKPKLIGRRLVQLPPAIKGTETSNLCCLS